MNHLSYFRKSYNRAISVSLFLMLMPVIPARDTITISMDDALWIALSHNASLKSAALRLEVSSKENAGIQLPPVEIKYRFGQLYSGESGQLLEISQDFGSILTHIREVKLKFSHNNLAANEFDAYRAEFTARVKNAYLLWQNSYAVANLYQDQLNACLSLGEIADLRYKSGDISLLEKSESITSISRAELNLNNSLDDISICYNHLMQLLQDTLEYLPENFQPEIYRVSKRDDTTAYSGSRILEIAEQKYQLARIDESIEGSKLFPSLQLGVYTQDITGLDMLYGGQVGISIPLWNYGRRNEIQEKRINTEIAFNNLENQKNQVNAEIEILLIKLNKYFRQLRHFQMYALPHADLLLQTAIAQLDTEEIDYEKFTSYISEANKIKLEYLDVLLNYNQTAIQLEFFAD